MTTTIITTTAPAVNCFEPRRIEGAEFEVVNTRTNKVVAVGFYGRDAAQDEADRLWHAELMASEAANPITVRREAAESAAPVGTCAGCGGACADDELYCSASCLDAFDDEPELHCEECGDILKPEAALDDGERVLCRPCFEDSLPDEPTPAQQAQRDAENEADMLEFILTSTPPAALPVTPALLSRTIAVLRLAADDLPRNLACEASLVADALSRLGRQPGEWGCKARAA
jgi:hypothetical protein